MGMAPRYNSPPPSYTFSVPGFTRAVKVLIIATAAVFVLQYASDALNAWLTGAFALFPSAVAHGQVWRLASYLFLHASLSHLFWNMFALWMFGVWVEEELGSTRLYQLYFVSGIGGAIIDVLWHLATQPSAFNYTIGASASVYGILLAVGLLFPEREVFLLLPPVAIKAKWLVLGYGALEFLFTLRGAGADGIAHFAHLGGMLFAFLYLRMKMPRFGLAQGYERWRRKQMQKKFEVYMNQRDRHQPPPGGWKH
ncbi:MAG TPA: rhomboid family intramembrane serine protease [Terriglobales bacterium]|nr:rhomboid family intramembrane serine protease [Terriglobales bacterium]